MRSARILRDFRVLPVALGRQEILIGAEAAGMALAAKAIVPAHAQSAAGKPDHALRISPAPHELEPGKVIERSRLQS
jgi:hypothetical protein